jgi:hypothetical protein
MCLCAPRYTIKRDRLIVFIKPFRLVYASITDSDNQGKVPNGRSLIVIIDRELASFSKIQLDYH